MNRLPKVLQNEIWEYIRGDRAFWKMHFEKHVVHHIRLIEHITTGIQQDTTFDVFDLRLELGRIHPVARGEIGWARDAEFKTHWWCAHRPLGELVCDCYRFNSYRF